MSVEDVSLADLDFLLDEVGDSLPKIANPKAKEHMAEVRRRIEEMKVAKVEIMHTESEFHRGNLTQDFYSMKHKQLTTDFIRARDSISNVHIPSLSQLAPDVQSKGRLTRLASMVADNKELVTGISQLIISVVSIFAGTASH